MKIKLKRAKLKHVAIFLGGISAASIATLTHADWSVTGLGTLGGTDSYAAGINDLGQVTGNAFILRVEIAMLSSWALTVPV